MTAQLNGKLLSDENLKNLSETFAHLKVDERQPQREQQKAGPGFHQSRRGGGLGEGTMKTTEDAANELKTAIADFRKTANSATKTMESGKGARRFRQEPAGQGEQWAGRTRTAPLGSRNGGKSARADHQHAALWARLLSGSRAGVACA